MTKSSADGHEFLEPAEHDSWNALLMLTKLVLARLDAELREAHRLTVTEFDVLITLYNAGDRRLPMTALADRVMLSPAGLTHLVTRLERDGLVRREVDVADRRRWFALLTEAGDARLRAARVTHNDVLRGSLLGVLSPAELRLLQRAWQRLDSRPSPGPAATADAAR